MIDVRNINKSFGNVQILKDVSYQFYSKKIYSVMGPSGAGKTTFLNVISGLLKTDSGQVVIDQDTSLQLLKEPQLTKFRAKNISYIFQQYNLLDFLTAKENILFSVNLNKQKLDKEKFTKIVKLLRIEEHLNKSPEQLSGGQQQRVAIARAIMSDAEYIFADEPTGALDLSTRSETLKLFKDVVVEYNKTLIIVTHDPSVASIADEVLFFLNGTFHKTLKNSNVKEITDTLQDLESKNVI